ncbi:MAG: hypothetical protein H6Q18_273 [Bacteroidetes bacterium]|nr:hypothetical protein [Bacteroidota bacterium]
MEGIEKGKTAKYLREKRGVPECVKENLKEFTQIKKKMTEALTDGELTVAQMSEKIGMSRPDTLYHLMSLVKFGVVKVGTVDDMDEYFTYKLNK